MVERAGLTVSLDHISFEDVIRDAGVSRSAAYRRWAYKDLFFSDLLRELARGASPAALPDGGSGTALARSVARDFLDRLETAGDRRALLVEMLRRAAAHGFDAILSSSQWRTYIALHAMFLGLADGELRDSLRDDLGAAEQRFTARIAATYEEFATLLGYRLRPGIPGFDTLATLLSAAMRGLVVTAGSSPDTAGRGLDTDPFGVGTATWTPAALSIASIALTLLVPDEAVAWDAERIAAVRRALG